MSTDLYFRRLAACQRWALAAGVLAGVGCAVGLVVARGEFFRAYLAGYLLWWEVAVGCLGLMMISHLIPSRWASQAQPYFAAGIATLPLVAILFVPLMFGLPDLYPWARADALSAHPGWREKLIYLNPAFFEGRAAGYFTIWIVLGLLLGKPPGTAREVSEQRMHRLAGVSAGGLVLLLLTVTFAAFDWSMSLEPDWYSTVYGALIGVGALLAGMAVAALAMAQRAVKSDPEPVATTSYASLASPLADVSTLLFALLMLWAYLAFSQYLIIWSGNLPHEAAWYLRRLSGGWERVALAVVVLHFAVPFLLLLSREVKSRPRAMTGVAALLLVMHWVDLEWHVTPAFWPGKPHVHWLDPLAVLAIGGIWGGVFLWQLRVKLGRMT